MIYNPIAHLKALKYRFDLSRMASTMGKADTPDYFGHANEKFYTRLSRFSFQTADIILDALEDRNMPRYAFRDVDLTNAIRETYLQERKLRGQIIDLVLAQGDIGRIHALGTGIALGGQTGNAYGLARAVLEGLATKNEILINAMASAITPDKLRNLVQDRELTAYVLQQIYRSQNEPLIKMLKESIARSLYDKADADMVQRIVASNVPDFIKAATEGLCGNVSRTMHNGGKTLCYSGLTAYYTVSYPDDAIRAAAQSGNADMKSSLCGTLKYSFHEECKDSNYAAAIIKSVIQNGDHQIAEGFALGIEDYVQDDMSRDTAFPCTTLQSLITAERSLPRNNPKCGIIFEAAARAIAKTMPAMLEQSRLRNAFHVIASLSWMENDYGSLLAQACPQEYVDKALEYATQDGYRQEVIDRIDQAMTKLRLHPVAV